jgi:hypothetical protein
MIQLLEECNESPGDTPRAPFRVRQIAAGVFTACAVVGSLLEPCRRLVEFGGLCASFPVSFLSLALESLTLHHYE